MQVWYLCAALLFLFANCGLALVLLSYAFLPAVGRHIWHWSHDDMTENCFPIVASYGVMGGGILLSMLELLLLHWSGVINLGVLRSQIG